MKMIITRKGVVDCTSDSRSYDMLSLQEGICNTIKILNEEILELDEGRFYINDNSKLVEYRKDDRITTTDKNICLKLLNYFKNNPEELSQHGDQMITVRAKVWKFFNDGDNCSDYIEVCPDKLIVSCQDEYDEEDRLQFHENIEELLGDDYVMAINDDLISLHINVTEKCEANCNTCYINRGLQRELEKEDWDNLPHAEQYAIGGGEPSEYPLISEFVDFLKEKRKGYVAITTNGQKIINFGQHLPDKIAVSIDGLTQEEHSKTHNTDLKIAEAAVRLYKLKGIKICINCIVHRENIDNIENFAKLWTRRGFEVNIILFVGEDSLKPTFEQLERFRAYFRDARNNKILIDSCMAGLLNLSDSDNRYLCQQGLYSKYYRFGATSPCSHSATHYPNCSTIESYMKHFFRSLRPIIFVYSRDGTSGAHEWAFKMGQRGKTRHVVDDPLRKDVIYILTDHETYGIKEKHYLVFFRDKMPYWLTKRQR